MQDDYPTDLLELVVLKYWDQELLFVPKTLMKESLYEITEPMIVNKWAHFSDEFRYTYRHKLYRE